MGSKDHSIDWARQREVIEAVNLSGLYGAEIDEDGTNNYWIPRTAGRREIVSGSNGAVAAGSLRTLTSAGTNFTTSGVVTTDKLVVAGKEYSITARGTTTLTLGSDVPEGTEIEFLVVRDAKASIRRISTYGAAGLFFEEAGATVQHNILIPSYWDLDKEIGVTLQFVTGSATAADGATFKVQYSQIEQGGVLPREDSNTPLDTPLVENEALGAIAYKVHETNRGHIDGGKLKKGSRLALEIELDATDVAMTTAEGVYLLSVILDYMPKFCWGTGVELDRPYRNTHSNE